MVLIEGEPINQTGVAEVMPPVLAVAVEVAEAQAEALPEAGLEVPEVLPSPEIVEVRTEAKNSQLPEALPAMTASLPAPPESRPSFLKRAFVPALAVTALTLASCAPITAETIGPMISPENRLFGAFCGACVGLGVMTVVKWTKWADKIIPNPGSFEALLFRVGGNALPLAVGTITGAIAPEVCCGTLALASVFAAAALGNGVFQRKRG